MTHDQSHHEHAQDAFIDALFEESPVNIAALLRACADGELNPEQCARLKALVAEHPEAESQHDFEEKLRDCCKRSMVKPCCPKALRDKIGSIALAYAESSAPEQEAYADRIEGASAYTSTRSFWARSPMMGIAAVLLLSVAGVLIWQSTSLFSANTPIPRVNTVGYSEQVGNFVIREHTRCSMDEAAQRKFTEREIESTVSYFSGQFQRAIAMPDMSTHADQIEFFGGGDCHVPMTSQSGHLRFDAQDASGNRISLSLFISPDPGQLDLEEGVTYRVNSKACADAGANLYIWVADGVQYVLVSEATDETCAMVRSIMNAPERLDSI